jgi:hypothetical protein
MRYKGGDILIEKCLKCGKMKVERLSRFVKKYERRFRK